MKVLIIEDETAAAVNLQAILLRARPDAEVLAVLESVTEAVEWFRTHPAPNLAFMDIHLADGDAFNIFSQVEVACPIVFTTAYDRYALEAFKVNSIDYLLKPIKSDDLKRALEKFNLFSPGDRKAYSERVAGMARQHGEEPLFLVHVRDKIIPLKASEVAFFYTFNEKVTAYTHEGAEMPMDRALDSLMNVLPERDFFRANRQFIVSRKAIRDISVWFGSRLSLNLTPKPPERVVVSKARVPELKRWLKGESQSH